MDTPLDTPSPITRSGLPAPDDLAAAVYEDLIGRKYGDLDCWRLVLEMVTRCRLQLDTFRECDGAVPQTYDIVFIRGDEKPHVGFIVSREHMLHSSRGTDGVALHRWHPFKERIQMVLRPM